jgi:hypothetical protein
MSAITLAQKKIPMGDPRVFLDTLDGLGFLSESVKVILESEDLVDFFKNQKTNQKTVRKKVTDEERLGQYDGNLCDARLWKEKPKSGGLGYDNIQCSSKKADECGCFCKKHFKMQDAGTLWTGLITEDRPEEPAKPDGTRMFWCTDENGDEVVKEKKARKKSSEPKKNSPKKKASKKDKEPDDYSTEELEALLAKKKKEKEEEEKEEEEKKEKEEEEKKEKEEEEDEENDEYEDITVEGVEYQLNKNDNTVIRIDDFSPVGVWNTDTCTIDFNDEEE